MAEDDKQPQPLFRRREVLATGVGAAATVALGGAFWRGAFSADDPTAAAALAHGGGYGPRQTADAHGIKLPRGFKARRVARGRAQVGDTGHAWHIASDGAAAFPTDDGGWILVSNSEDLDGGAGAIRFARDGSIKSAYPVLHGTSYNCAGGPTPWGTWLSCEEYLKGRVWECDPTGRHKAKVHTAMGRFKHEAAAVDPHHRHVYLTEDLIDGALYRFTPRHWPSLAHGKLELAKVDKQGKVSWIKVPDHLARTKPTRYQVPDSTRFHRAEGIWFDSGTIYLTTTADSQVHAYDTRTHKIEVIYDGLASPGAPLLSVDNLTASHAGELFVCEDNGQAEQDIGVINRKREVERFLTITGPNHKDSELTGLAFDPSGSRLYFSSQRAHGGVGEIYEVRGPFRGRKHQRVAA